MMPLNLLERKTLETMEKEFKRMKVFLTENEIQVRVATLGRDINTHYSKLKSKEEVRVVGILNGSIIFLSDLIRHFEFPYTVDFLNAKSYKNNKSKGYVEVDTVGGLANFQHSEVLIVEDIIDSGKTINVVRNKIRTCLGPKRVSVASLLYKNTDAGIFDNLFVGFCIPTNAPFLAGYGLDNNGLDRGKKYIYCV